MEGADSKMSFTKRVMEDRQAARAVLAQINASQDTNRGAHESGQHHHQKRAVDGVGQPALFIGRWGHLSEHGQLQAADASPERFPQNPDQPDQTEGHRHHRQSNGDLVDPLTGLEFNQSRIAHDLAPS